MKKKMALLILLMSPLLMAFSDGNGTEIELPVALKDPLIQIDGNIKRNTKSFGKVKPTVISRNLKLESSTVPTNTFQRIKSNTPVFSDDDFLGFNAIRELQRNSATIEALKNAIIASGHQRGGASLEKTVMILSDGSRIEAMTQVENGILNSDSLVVPYGSEATEFSTYCDSLKEFYAGTNILEIGETAIRQFNELEMLILPSVTNLGIGAIIGNTKLKTVIAPKLVDMETQAMYANPSLKVVHMPKLSAIGMTEISGTQYGYAFMNCTALEELFLPSLEEISGPASFMGCTALKTFSAPRLKHIYGQQVFINCTNLRHVNALELESISDYTFWNCSSLKHVDFPSITAVGKVSFGKSGLEHISATSLSKLNFGEFKQAYNLRIVDLPNLTSAPSELNDPANRNDGFAYGGMTKVELPKIELIGGSTFENCQNLTTVVIPNCTSLWHRAFAGCPSLEEVYFCNSITGVTSIASTSDLYPLDGCIFADIDHKVNIIVPDNLYDEWKENESWKIENVTIYSWSNYKPVRIRDVLKYASNSPVNMGNGYTNIVFSMGNTKKFTIDENAHTVSFSIDPDSYEFGSGEAFVTVISPGTTTLKQTRIGTGYSPLNVDFVPKYNASMYSSLNQLLTINGPATVKFQFQMTGDNYLVVVHGSHTTNGEYILDTTQWSYPYIYLTKTTIGGEEPSIANLTRITMRDGRSLVLDIEGVITQTTMRNLGLTISDGNWGTNDIDSVVLGDSVTGLDNNAFYNCKTLSSLTIPSSVTNIGFQALMSCTNLSTVTIAPGLKTIGVQAFDGCKALQSLTLPDTVEILGGLAFNSCMGLSSINLGNGVRSIGGSGDYAYATFTTCIALSSITIPESCTSINAYTFYNTQSLRDVTFVGKTKTQVQSMSNYSSWGLNSGCVIHCSDGQFTK